jgi:hypothetical protein
MPIVDTKTNQLIADNKKKQTKASARFGIGDLKVESMGKLLGDNF